MTTDLDIMKKNMIDGQLKPMGISNDRLIDAFLTVPREIFLPEENELNSYSDGHTEIKEGRWLLSSLSIARLINTVNISPDDIILEIGSTTGYATAILAHLAALVIGVEYDNELAKITEKNLSQISYDNTVIIKKDHSLGYEKSAPYDKIFIFGTIPKVLDDLLVQLSEYGSLVSVVKDPNNTNILGKAVVIQKNKEAFSISEIYEETLPMMIGFEEQEIFKF